MRKISAALIAVLMAAATLTMASPAQAVDHRTCVTLGEFRAIHRPMTYAQVKGVLDGDGILLARVDNGYYEGAWIDDGYWDSTYIDDGYYDLNDNWIDTSYWEDEWVDMSYYDDSANWVSFIDTVRSYPKCANFDRHGARRLGVNFDNYSSAYSGMRMWTKSRSNPWSLVDIIDSLRTTGGSNKPAPHAGARPAKPAPKPLTPDPHPHSGTGLTQGLSQAFKAPDAVRLRGLCRPRERCGRG